VEKERRGGEEADEVMVGERKLLLLAVDVRVADTMLRHVRSTADAAPPLPAPNICLQEFKADIGGSTMSRVIAKAKHKVKGAAKASKVKVLLRIRPALGEVEQAETQILEVSERERMLCVVKGKPEGGVPLASAWRPWFTTVDPVMYDNAARGGEPILGGIATCRLLFVHRCSLPVR
jgi:hypothetical protein